MIDGIWSPPKSSSPLRPAIKTASPVLVLMLTTGAGNRMKRCFATDGRPMDGDDQIAVMAEADETHSTRIVIRGHFSENLPDLVRSLDRTDREWLSSSISTDPPSTSRYTSR